MSVTQLKHPTYLPIPTYRQLMRSIDQFDSYTIDVAAQMTNDMRRRGLASWKDTIIGTGLIVAAFAVPFSNFSSTVIVAWGLSRLIDCYNIPNKLPPRIWWTYIVKR